MKLYKITNEQENHNGLQYQTGLNIDPIEFNPSGTCLPGGIYYTTKEHIVDFFEYGPWIRTVTIPKGAKTYKDPDGDKWKADKIILGKRRKICSLSVYKELEEYILKSPKSAYLYLRELKSVVNKKTIKLLEKTIATDAHHALNCAVYILKGRFELGEKIIAQSAGHSYRYAKDIIKGRFELGEKSINKSNHHKYNYERDVLKQT